VGIVFKSFLNLLRYVSLSKLALISLTPVAFAANLTLHSLDDVIKQHKLTYQSTLEINSHRISTEVVDNNQTRARGLMFRASLPADAGMLFVFDDEKTRCFWMKNTFIPLSIAYINAEGKIIDIRNMEPQDQTSICSAEPAKFALEVNQGWFEKHKVSIGDTIWVVNTN